MNAQKDKTHYNFNRYSYVGRFASYYYQLHETFALEPESVLEIGVGDKLFGSYLRKNTKIAYASLDVAEDLQPDIVGSVLNIPREDNSYDVVCCFEVLEHLPYKDVPKALSELNRVASKGVVISVPHFGPRTQFFLKLPFLPEIKCAIKIPWPQNHTFDGEHYWELGKRGYRARAFRRLLERHGTITHDFIPFENQYHHFYVLNV